MMMTKTTRKVKSSRSRKTITTPPLPLLLEKDQISSRILGYSAAGSQHMQEEGDNGQGWVSSKQDIQKMKAISKLNAKTNTFTIDASLTTIKNKEKNKKNTEVPNSPLHQPTVCTNFLANVKAFIFYSGSSQMMK